MAKKVDVLLDRKRNEISICTIDDTTSVEVETTLSVAEAWNLVADLNESLQKLAIANETRIQVTGNAKLNKDQLDELEKALEKSNKAFSPETYHSKIGKITVNVDASGEIDPAKVEVAVRRVLSKPVPPTNAVATNPVPKSTHRPYSGTMNN